MMDTTNDSNKRKASDDVGGDGGGEEYDPELQDQQEEEEEEEEELEEYIDDQKGLKMSLDHILRINQTLLSKSEEDRREMKKLQLTIDLQSKEIKDLHHKFSPVVIPATSSTERRVELEFKQYTMSEERPKSPIPKGVTHLYISSSKIHLQSSFNNLIYFKTNTPFKSYNNNFQIPTLLHLNIIVKDESLTINNIFPNLESIFIHDQTKSPNIVNISKLPNSIQLVIYNISSTTPTKSLNFLPNTLTTFEINNQTTKQYVITLLPLSLEKLHILGNVAIQDDVVISNHLHNIHCDTQDMVQRFQTKTNINSISIGHLQHDIIVGLEMFSKLECLSILQMEVATKLPTNIKQLHLKDYTQFITNQTFPETLTTLDLDEYNYQLQAKSFPESLIHLRMSKYNKPIIADSLPKSLRTLMIPSFTDSIFALPEALDLLALSDSFKKVYLPKTFKGRIVFIRDHPTTTPTFRKYDIDYQFTYYHSQSPKDHFKISLSNTWDPTTWFGCKI